MWIEECKKAEEDKRREGRKKRKIGKKILGRKNKDWKKRKVRNSHEIKKEGKMARPEIESSVQMRLYTLTKRQFIVVFLVFAAAFAFFLSVGIIGPAVMEEVKLNATCVSKGRRLEGLRCFTYFTLCSMRDALVIVSLSIKLVVESLSVIWCPQI